MLVKDCNSKEMHYGILINIIELNEYGYLLEEVPCNVIIGVKRNDERYMFCIAQRHPCT